MDIKQLLSGIAVAIDDAFGPQGESNDRIFQLVNSIEETWKVPFYKTHKIPSDDVCNNLLRSASFVLLDWQLWPNNKGDSELEKQGVKDNVNFLQNAKNHFVPVFIFTNENPEDIESIVCKCGLYDKNYPGKNFIFVRRKSAQIRGGSLPSIKKWMSRNHSVYTLKTWELAFCKSKENLFSSMYGKSPSWPREFWSSYKKDGVDPSSSMVNLINNNIFARMETNIFEDAILNKRPYMVDGKDIKSIWEGASFITKEKLLDNDIRSGDMFKEGRKYFINIRADCDCVPRRGRESISDVVLYCVEGKSITSNQIKKLYDKGHFNERIWQSIVFGVYAGKTIELDFRKFSQKPFNEVKDKRIGRLIHPYITRIQQRYALYIQRQGLPRIPEKAINTNDET